MKGHEELECFVQLLSLANAWPLIQTLRGKERKGLKGRELGRTNSSVAETVQKLRVEIRKPKGDMDASLFLSSLFPQFLIPSGNHQPFHPLTFLF